MLSVAELLFLRDPSSKVSRHGGFAMAQMQSKAPARKVWVGSLVGAATAIVIWIIESIGPKVPGGIAVAISTLLTGIVSYLVPPADSDQVV